MKQTSVLTWKPVHVVPEGQTVNLALGKCQLWTDKIGRSVVAICVHVITTCQRKYQLLVHKRCSQCNEALFPVMMVADTFFFAFVSGGTERHTASGKSFE